jgi:hypothetical protein
MNAVTQLKPATVTLWGKEYPVSVHHDGKGWWIAEPEGYRGPACGASRHSPQDAVERLLTSVAWHMERPA